MKFSIMMPTYNDCESIEKTFDSIISQNYDNWELIIINDGSTDDTTRVVNDYINSHNLNGKFKYIVQEKNTDQLLAIINGSKYITGDYVYLLHSDDLFASPDSLLMAKNYLEKHPDIDGILPNILIIDKDDNVTSTQKLLKYSPTERIMATDLVWMGRNMYSDFPVIKKEIFLTKMKKNYLVWNGPFWLNFSDEGPSMLNMKNAPFCVFKYRVYDGNYANNDLGLACLMNGELRCATSLMKFYHIPFYSLQYFLFRSFVHLKLFNIYRPIYFKRPTKNPGWLVEHIIKMRYPNGYDNVFYDGLIGFYKNLNNREVIFEDLFVSGDPVYEGNGFRLFNKQVLGHCLPETYTNFINEMKSGFTKLKVKSENKEDAVKILKFLCIYYFVEIIEY